MLRLVMALIISGWSLWAGAAPLTVSDGSGQRVTLRAPAQRIISLAPHTTEMLFSAGAGARIVGAVDYSDYPEPAKAIPRVGSYNRFDLEAIVALRPDLVVGWKSGNNAAALEKLQRLGIPLFRSEPHHLETIADEIDALAVLADTQAATQPVTRAWRQRLNMRRAQYRNSPPVSVFYEVWNQPLMTVSGQHLISDVIALCGGSNVFAQLPALSAEVSREAVLAADPQVIIASGMGEEHPEWLDDWRRWPHLKAVQGNHLYFIPPALLQRHTLRILDGAERMCGQIARVRRN
ncbi:MAG TPA: cobalamin-binding protein [Gammaproteobacteria bacterium]